MTCLLLGLSVLFSGCDSNTSSATAPDQPKNQFEGLQRIRAANEKHDRETAKNKGGLPKR